MTGTLRFRPRHRAVPKMWTSTFVTWCVAMVLVSAAAGVWLGTALAGR